jgi:hypothetical protein
MNLQATTCQFEKSNGQPCRRTIRIGGKFCWQHARGLKTRWRALTRNQTIIFLLTVVGVLDGLPFLVGKINSLLSPPLALSASIETGIVDRQRAGGAIAATYISGYGKTVSPVAIALCIRVLNRQEHQAKIDA